MLHLLGTLFFYLFAGVLIVLCAAFLAYLGWWLWQFIGHMIEETRK
jgi:hypothetical protein